MSTIFNFSQNQGYVLIAEDSNVQAKKLRFLLEDHGFETLVCPNGSVALSEVQKRKPLLIISDIVMPEMDGYEFCSRIKAEPAFKDIPFMLLTSLRDPLDIIRGLQAGADNFITKPYEDNYLLSRVQYLLANTALRQSGSADIIVEVIFKGERYSINSDKKQILDLLLSVYEAAVQRNDELILAQAKLEALNEDLLNANHELEAFAHTVSHDLRSPLHTVRGYLQILQEEYDTVLDDSAKKYLEVVMKSADSMAQLIEDLLHFSRSAKAQLNIKEINLHNIAREILNRMRMREPERPIEWKIAEDLTTRADPALMEIVLENLLSNAWKYTRKSNYPLIIIGRREQEGSTVFYVKDNGAGFDPEKAYKMFNPFERLHTNEEFPGIGVGLATVKRILERHGGKIWAEGKPGEGATFYFSLPPR